MYSSEKSNPQQFTPAYSATAPHPQFGEAPAKVNPVSSANQTHSSWTNPTDAAPPLPQRPVPWSTGICHCDGDIETWCITCWFPCITFGKISEIVDQGSSSCIVNGAIYALIMHSSCFQWVYACANRSKMRQQYNIEGNCYVDCLASCCCDRCALRQEYRELKFHGFDMNIGWQGNMERQNRGVAMPATVQQGMTR